MLNKIQTYNQILNQARIINKMFRLMQVKNKTRAPRHQINKLTRIQKVQMILPI